MEHVSERFDTTTESGARRGSIIRFLPTLINSSLDESRPAFTPDSRYLGFIRRGSDGHERVFVFDNKTQTLVNEAGADLGPVVGACATSAT